MTPRVAVARLLVGGASVAVAMKMADRVDRGLPGSWPAWAHLVWAAIILVLILFGAGTLVRVIGPLLGDDEVRWFPSRAERGGRQGVWAVLGAGVGIALSVVVIAIVRPVLAARAAVAGIGVFLWYITLARSRGFWDVPILEGWRLLLGDRVIVIFYLLIGLGCIAFAIFGNL